MKVRSITPIHVPDDELARRRQRYARLAPAGVEIHLDDLGRGPEVPRRLDDAASIEVSSDLVLAMALATDPSDFDLVLPDCVLDPAVRRAEVEPVPIVGILELAAGHLAVLRQPFTVVTRNDAIGAEAIDRLELYGLADWVVSSDVLDLDFDAIADEGRWDDALAPVRREAGRRGAHAVINGCSAVDVAAGDGATVVDPTHLALQVLGAGGAAGLFAGPRRAGGEVAA